MTSLELSIKKWENIANGTGADNGTYNCALCKEYYNIRCDDDPCELCSVYRETGRNGCNGTPYEDWIRHHEYDHDDNNAPENTKAICPKCFEIAEREVKFLKGLR